MAADSRGVNLREEEKELDDKLMELGLLEPGMTLQEKRDLASVVLESTRMAEEQKNQRSVEEEWESVAIDPKPSGSNDATSRCESPELITISFTKKESAKPSSSGISSQKRRDNIAVTQRETQIKGRNQMEKDMRERRGKREREEDKEEMIVVEVDEEDEVVGKRDTMDGRRVEARKDEGTRVFQFSRRKKEEIHAKKEVEVEMRPQKKVPGAEEGKDKRERREVEEIKEVRGEEMKRGSPMAEKRGRKEVDLTQESGPQGSPKVVAASNEKTVAVPKVSGVFYGPTCSSNVKELNPLRSELHGYSRKRGPPRSPQVSLLQLAKEDVPLRKKPLDEAEIEELVLDDEASNDKRCDGTFTRGVKERKSSAEERDAENMLFLEKNMGSKKILQEKSDVGKSSDDIVIGDDDWEAQRPGIIWLKEARKRNAIGDGPAGRREGAFRSLTMSNSGRAFSQFSGAGKMKRKEQDVEAEIEEGSEVEEDEKGQGETSADGRSPLSDFIVEGKKKRRLAKGSSSKKWVDVVIFPNSSCVSISDENKETAKSSKKIRLPPNKSGMVMTDAKLGDHAIEWDKLKLLCQGRRFWERLTKESIEIGLTENSLNHCSGFPLKNLWVTAQKYPGGKKKARNKETIRRHLMPNTLHIRHSALKTKDKSTIEASAVMQQLTRWKTWRRVNRKARSSFGSGSEVDEWISSEEEQQSHANALTKEQLVARFDEQLDRLKEEKMKKAPSGNKYSRCKLCERKSTLKVPPGFQEPDSDDEWNLWKICFFKPPPTSSDEKLKSNSKKEKLKADATPLTLRSTLTRSQSKLTRDFRSTRSASKSPASFEDDASNSPENQEKVPVINNVTSGDVARSKSPRLGEVVLFDKVIQSRPCSTMGTQTTWEEDENTSASSSQADSVTSGPKSKGEANVAEPVWDLLEINSDGEEVVVNSQEGNERVTEALKNVTVRRGQSESPEYLPLEVNDDDDDGGDNVSRSSNSVALPETVVRASASFSGESVAVPSPVIPRVPRRGKPKAAEGRKEDQSVKPDSAQHRGGNFDARISQYEENEEVQEIPVATPVSKDDDLPEAIPCPICNREFPMSEIEAHASECGQEEEDPLPRALRDGGNSRQREEMDGSETAGASREQFDVEMRECDEEEEDDDSQFEAGCSMNEHAPRPARLSTYVPISQQKDSYIDYSDQFSLGNRSVDIQATLGRIRQSLLKRVRKKTKWRRKRKPKWRGKKL